jgi:hypothetical protein
VKEIKKAFENLDLVNKLIGDMGKEIEKNRRTKDQKKKKTKRINGSSHFFTRDNANLMPLCGEEVHYFNNESENMNYSRHL